MIDSQAHPENQNKAGVARVDVTPLAPFMRWLCGRTIPHLPVWVMPNHITVAGCIAAILAGVSFGLAGFSRTWFFGAAFMLVIYAFADCLDGELARARRLISERGFFLDILLDDVSFMALYLGIAYSGYVSFQVMALGAIVHLLSDVVVTLRIHLREQHVIPSFGPTEICFLLVVFSLVAFFYHRPVFLVSGYALNLFDAAFVLATTGGLVELVQSAGKLYRELDGPSPHRAADAVSGKGGDPQA